MDDNLIAEKLRSIADDFTCGCGDWGSPRVFSPPEYLEHAKEEFRRLPNPSTRQRLEAATDQWAFIFSGRRVANSRGEPGYSVHDARAFFTPEQASSMTPAEIRNMLIAILAEREIHQVLEWAQLKSRPGVPIVDPHEMSDELYEVVSLVANAVLKHATRKPPPGH